MTVIAVDGIYVTPKSVDVIQLYPGYRMDVLVVCSDRVTS
jgi:FtsP/CotA-like multicopper oxidase with cupredoxin domain